MINKTDSQSVVGTAKTSQEVGWMGKAESCNSGLSANELTSLSALIAHVSQKTGVSEFRAERELSDRFNVPNMKCLPSALFEDAVRFLIHWAPTKITGT